MPGERKKKAPGARVEEVSYLRAKWVYVIVISVYMSISSSRGVMIIVHTAHQNLYEIITGSLSQNQKDSAKFSAKNVPISGSKDYVE